MATPGSPSSTCKYSSLPFIFFAIRPLLKPAQSCWVLSSKIAVTVSLIADLEKLIFLKLMPSKL